MTEPKLKRGKKTGHRSIKDLHARILTLIQTEKKDWTAYSISKKLEVPDPTVRLYLLDLVEQKKISAIHLLGVTVYRPRKPINK